MTSDEFDRDEQSRRLSWRAYWSVAVRRRWSFLAPWLLFGIAATLAARFWPFLYRSQSLILVEQQRVPEQYVVPNVIASLQVRLENINQQIRSRTRLQRLIEELGLYARERSRMSLDEVVDRMRDHIEVELVQTPGRASELAGFRVYYSASDPYAAQRVTNQLTSMFIDENLRSRTQQSLGTTAFLEAELEDARKALADQEQVVRAYQLKHLGQLPAQQQSNLQVMGALEAQLRATETALDRAEQQRVYLDAMRAQYLTLEQTAANQETFIDRAASLVRPADGGEDAALRTDLRRRLLDLRSRYTPEHPEIKSIEGQLAQLQPREQASNDGRSNTGKLAASAPGKTLQTGLLEIDGRLKAVAVEIASGKKDAERLRKDIESIQARLELTPVREQELSELTRKLNTAREHYETLLQKKLQSELASNLERRQQGEQFRILDAATLPRRPEGRVRLIVIGWMLGSVMGVLLVTLREGMDGSVHSAADLPPAARLLAAIPVLRTRKAEARHRWKLRLEAAAVAILTLSAAAGSVQAIIGG